MAHRQLLLFAQSQGPSSSYIRNGNVMANEIFCSLRRGTDYVDRVIISGSMGKKTSLTDKFEPDFDLVIFCNNKEPFFVEVLSDFARILCHTDGVEIIRENIYMIQIAYKSYSFDICPAFNFVKNMQQTDTVTLQRLRTYREIEALADPINLGPLYSTSLAETAVQFMKIQSAYVHNLARLGKYWNSVIGGPYFYGRKLMIETVAVYTGKKAENNKKPFGVGFEEFLKQMENLNTANCICYDFYSESKVPNTLPIVLDPSNPWNNLLKLKN